MKEQELRSLIREEVEKLLTEKERVELNATLSMAPNTLLFNELVSDVSFRINSAWSEWDHRRGDRMLNIDRDQINSFLMEFQNSDENSKEFDFDASIFGIGKPQYPARIHGKLAYNEDNILMLYVDWVEIQNGEES